MTSHDNKKHSFTTEIRNGDALAKLAKRLQPVLLEPEAPPQTPTADFFQRLNMASKIEANLGSAFTIDVQPDFRFPMYYSIYNTVRLFPQLDIKCYPYVSPFTLIAYEQALIYAHLLLSDIHYRPTTSSHANFYRRDNSTGDLLSKLMEATVPQHLEPLIQQLISVYDPNHPDLCYTPNLAAFSWTHDFGRLLPINIMFAAHNCIATSRINNPTPESVTLDFYNTTVTTVNGVHYTVANLIGGWYSTANQSYAHDNWLNTAVEEIFNPIVGRALTNRPTLKKLTVTPTAYNQADQINPYSYALAYSETNLQTLMHFIDNLSDFTKAAKRGTKTVLQLSAESSGITLLSHSLEPPTLPTWHAFDHGQVNPVHRTDAQYAEDIHFMRPKILGEGELAVPTPDECLPILALVMTADCTANNDPFPADTFDSNRNVRPPVHYFQPYDRSSSTLNYTVILGIKIESAELDAVAIPTPNQWDSLIDNNSRYRQGSVPVSQLYSTIPSQAHPIIISRRILHPDYEDPIGLAIVDMSRNILPRFGNAHVTAPGAHLPGFVPVQRVHRANDAFTYTATHGDNDYPTHGRLFYLWSSYRYVEVPNASTPSIHFFYSLRGMYGTAVLLQRSDNPARLLPR